MKKPRLNEIIVPAFYADGGQYITASPGQWDGLLQSSYDAGWTILEVRKVNGKEKVTRAFRKLDNKN